MADREDILAWLRGARWRHVYSTDPRAKIVDRLVSEGRAERIGIGSRVRATKRTFETRKEKT